MRVKRRMQRTVHFLLLQSYLSCSANRSSGRLDVEIYGVPISLDGATAAQSIFEATVMLCSPDSAAHGDASFSQSSTLATRNLNCTGGKGTWNTTLAQLVDNMEARGCHAGHRITNPGCAPSALIFHSQFDGGGGAVAARALVAAYSALQNVAVYMASDVEAALVSTAKRLGSSREDTVVALRAIVAAVGSSAFSKDSPPLLCLAIDSAIGVGASEELASLMRSAFPEVAWVFAYDTSSDVEFNVDATVAMAGSFTGVGPLLHPLTSACKSKAQSDPLVRLLLGESTSSVAHSLSDGTKHDLPWAAETTVEEICAAALASEIAAVLVEAAAARDAALRRALPDWEHGSVVTDDDDAADVSAAAFNATAVATFLADDETHVGPVFDVDMGIGMLLSSRRGRGSVMGRGQGVLYNFQLQHQASESNNATDAAVDVMLTLIRRHLAARRQPQVAGDAAEVRVPNAQQGTVQRLWFSSEEEAAARLAARQVVTSAHNEIVEQGLTRPAPRVGATEDRSSSVCHGTETSRSAQAVRKFVAPVEAAVRAFHGRHKQEGLRWCRQTEVSAADAAPRHYDIRMMPLGAGYPVTFPLRDILTAWNPDVTSIPAHYGRFSSLRLFNGSDDTSMAEALLYRRTEVPFVVRRPPGIRPAMERWVDDAYIAAHKEHWTAEFNEGRHFMFVNWPKVYAGERFDEGVESRPPHPRLDRVDTVYWQRQALVAELMEESEEAVAAETGIFSDNWMAPREYQGSAQDRVPGREINSIPIGDVALPPPRNRATSAAATVYGLQIAATMADDGRGGGPMPRSMRIPFRSPRTLIYPNVDTDVDGMDPEAWMKRDLPLFDPVVTPDSFFVVDVRPPKVGPHQHILCRLGMRGIIAVSYWVGQVSANT